MVILHFSLSFASLHSTVVFSQLCLYWEGERSVFSSKSICSAVLFTTHISLLLRALSWFRGVPKLRVHGWVWLEQVMGARYERTRLGGTLSSHPLLPLPHGQGVKADGRTTGRRVGAGACGTAAAAQAREGAWRQTYMVPRIC